MNTESSNSVHTLPSISLSSILILPSHLQVDLQRAVFNVWTSLLHHTYHCSTSLKIAGSTLDGVNGIFH